MADEGYLVDRELKKELDSETDFVTRGAAEDYANYMYHCGKIRGISFAMQTLEDARNKAIRDEDA
jgi:hypothetical protein